MLGEGAGAAADANGPLGGDKAAISGSAATHVESRAATHGGGAVTGDARWQSAKVEIGLSLAEGEAEAAFRGRGAAADSDGPLGADEATISGSAATHVDARAAAHGGGAVAGDARWQSAKVEIELSLSEGEAEAALRRGLDNDQLSPQETPLAARDVILTPSLGPGPMTYLSEAHAVEFELQAGSLDEELPVKVTITQSLAFVDCRTEGSGRYDDWIWEDLLLL